MNANTSTEGNGKKELKVTQTNDADKLIDKYFEDFREQYPDFKRDLKEDAEYVLSTHSITFKTNEQAVKTQGGEDNENEHSIDAINVLESGKRDFILEEIAKGAGLNVKLADLRKVKAKTEKIRKEKQSKEEEKTEKPAREER